MVFDGVARVSDRAARRRRGLILATWISRPISLADVTPRAKGGIARLPISIATEGDGYGRGQRSNWIATQAAYQCSERD